MKIENPMRFVRELKGAPLSIVVLLALTGQALSNQAICAGTGYSDKTTAGALDYLAEVGMVVRAAGGWRIAEGVQLALPMGSAQIADTEEITAKAPSTLSNSDDSCGSRKISDSEPLVNIVVNTIDLNKEDLTTNYINGEESEKFRLCLEAMAEVGIQATEKTRELARKEHVDALYILSHAEQVKREGQKVGLAIWRMAKGMPRPLRRMSTGHLEGCECADCKYEWEKTVMSEAEEWGWFRGDEVGEDDFQG